MRFLLDEHLSPRVARELRARGIDAVALRAWREGAFLQQPDERILEAAGEEGRVLMTHDVHSIPLLLKAWAETGRYHAGVILVSAAAITPDDYGGLIHALVALAGRDRDLPWLNRVVFLEKGSRG